MASLRKSYGAYLNGVDENRRTRILGPPTDSVRQQEINSTIPVSSCNNHYVTNTTDRRQAYHFDLECPDIRSAR
jgi:hypothetical protein